MMTQFDAGEIFTLAAQIERDGANLYQAAAKVATGQTKALLERLAAMEADHERTFIEMQEGLEHIDSHIQAGASEESLVYLRAKVQGKVFCNDVPTSALGGMCIEDILKNAIELEKDTIVFYQCLKEQIATSVETARRIDTIIKQEIGHILELTKQLDAVKGK